MEKLRILVVEDNPKHQEAAREQLANHDLMVVSGLDPAIAAIKDGQFDVVMTDLLMPKGGRECMGTEGMRFVFDELAYGFPIAFIALANGVKRVGILTDANHHNHPMSFAIDHLSSIDIGDVKVVFTNRCGSSKNWDQMLEWLFSE